MLSIYTLLVVASGPEARAALAALPETGYRLLWADDGARALALLTQHPEVDLLAAESGETAWLACARLLPDCEHLPTLALAQTDEAAEQALQDGATDVLRLPCAPTEAGRRIGNLARLHRLERETGGQTQAAYHVLDFVSYGIGLYRYREGRLHAIYVNPAFKEMGVSAPEGEETDAEALLPMLSKPDAERLMAYLADEDEERPLELECSAQYEGGERRRQRLQAFRAQHASGRPSVVLISLADVTRQYNAEDELAKTSRQLRALIDAVPGGILIFEPSTAERPIQVIYINDAVHDMLGYTREEYLGAGEENIKRHILPEDIPLVESMVASIHRESRRMSCTFRVRHKDGGERSVFMTCAPVSNTSGRFVCNAVFLDITKEKNVERQSELATRELQYRAEHDALTGICNRDSFFQKTESMLQQHPDEHFILAIIDLDRFKVVNDLFGKDVGDRVLICIADTLRQQYRHRGTYSRIESDTFALCCREDELDCDRLHQAFLDRLAAEGIDYRIETSFGLYRVHTLRVPVLKMCDRATMAMRTVKNSAVRRFAYYDDQLRQALLEEQEIIDSMNDALVRGEFVPYVQPIYNISTGKPVSAEVLVRWDHPRRGFISPGLFVPLFERNGFITKLDASVWERACQLLGQWKQAGYKLPLSVNMSRIDLYNPKLCEQLVELVRRYDIEPAMLKLEITESAYAENPDELLAVVNRLRELGFHILMDDFGSGYSSLNTLKDMPVDTLKIDMRFLAELETSTRAASIITSVVRMAKWLGIPVIAEGVETQQQVDFLRSIGCDQVQGYFFAKPMSVDAFETMLAGGDAGQPSENGEPMAIDLSTVWDANEQFNLLINGMISGIGLYELAGDALEIQRVNDAYYALFGITPQQLFATSRNALEQLEPDDRQAALAACHRAVASRQVESVTLRRYHQDGRMMWIDVKMRYISRAGDHPVFYMTLNDVSQQKEFELARSFRQYTDALRSLYSALFELDFAHDSYRVAYQASGMRLPEGESRQMTNHVERYLKRVHPDDREALREAFQEGALVKRLQGQPSYRLEVRTRIGQEYSWFACYFFCFRDATQGRTTYLLGIRDIDAQKRAQQLEEENLILHAKQYEQERYQTLMEEAGTSLLEWDLAKDEHFASSGYQRWRLSEYPLQELVRGQYLEQIVQAEDLPVARRVFEQAEHGSNVTAVLRLLKRNGGAAWCRLIVAIGRDEQGRPQRITATLSEIDEQIRAQESYLQSQMQFQAFADNLMVGLGIYEVRDGQSHVLYLTDGYYRILGYDNKEQFDHDHTGVYRGVHPDDCPRFDQAIQELLRTDKPFTLEYRAYARGGTMLWLRTQTRALPEKPGENRRLLAVIVDITELKDAQRHLQNLLNEMPAGMGIYELDGDTVTPKYVNIRAPEMLGYGHEEFMEYIQGRNKALTPEELERIRAAQQKVLQGTYSTQSIREVVRKDGKSVWLQALTRVTLNKTGKTACYCLITDVTDDVAARRRLRWQEERYRLLAEHTDSILFDYDVENDVISYTVRARGFPTRELTVSRHMGNLEESEIIHPSFRGVYRAAMLSAMDHACEERLECLADFSGDGYRWCRMFYVSVADESGRVFRVVGRVLDIDREKGIERNLQIERKYRQALLSETLYVYDLTEEGGTLLHAAPYAEERYLPWQEYLVEERNRVNFHPDDWDALRRAIRRDFHKPDMQEARQQFRLRDRKGRWVWVEATLHPLLDADDGGPRLLLYLKVVDKQKRREEELRTRAEFDPISGVFNRGTTEQHVNAALADAENDAFLLIDVDDFKHINDTLGHAMGDEAIRVIGRTLQECVRAEDVVGRVGGDEFIVLLAHLSRAEDAVQKAKHLLDRLQTLRLSEEETLHATASIGLAYAPRDGRTFDELYRKSDEAMYRAKSAGKAQLVVYGES